MLKAENLNPALADISVIISAYNRAGMIGETLLSLLNQSLQAKEIVVDDGSSDGTAEKCSKRLKTGNLMPTGKQGFS